MHKILTSLLLIILNANCLFAQVAFPKFSKIRASDLRTNWERDYPNTPAVILHDYGEVAFELNSRAKVRYTFHRRIKILNAEGLEYAQVRIPIQGTSTRRNRIQKLDAFTYRLNLAGKVMKAGIDKRMVEEVQIDETNWELRFKFPLVEVGAILEYTYSYLADDMRLIRLWNFQQDLPLVLSEYHTFFPENLTFYKLTHGDLSFVEFAQEIYDQPISKDYYFSNRFTSLSNGPFDLRGEAGDRLGGFSIKGIHSVFIAKDMPPIEREPHVQSIRDYVPGLSFRFSDSREREGTTKASAFNKKLAANRLKESELLGLPRLPHQLPGYQWLETSAMSLRQQAREWEAANKELLRHTRFGRQLDKYEELEQRGNRIARRYREPTRKASIIYDHVRKRMEWNGTYSMYASNLEKAYEQKSGSSAAINLILIKMLRGAGLNAFPALIRTRDKGQIIHLLPGLDHFNHVIVVVQLPDQIALIDGLSEVVAFGMLPRNDLNRMGFVIDKDEWGWIQINPEDIFSRTYGSFDLDASGRLSGSVEVTHSEYSAAIERGRWKNDPMEDREYVNQYVLNGLKNSEVYEYKIRNLQETDTVFIASCTFSTSEFVEVVNDYMFVQPMMTRMVSENPFPAVERTYPVSFAAPTRDYYLFGMKVPSGYEVAQMPSPIYVRLGEKGGEFVYNVFQDGEYLFITSAIHLAQTYFSSRAYPELNDFFDYIVAKHGEDIVLRKINQ